MKNQPKRTLTKDYGLFIVTVRIERGKPIEELMNDKEKQLTGLARLTPQQLASLNEWFDIDKVQFPVDRLSRNDRTRSS
jgi:hypothetical protein